MTQYPPKGHVHAQATSPGCCVSGWTCTLTLLVGSEEDAEAAPPAALVCPHADDAQRGDQHDVVGHRGAELAL